MRTPTADGPSDERRGELAGSAHRYREAVLLAEPDEEPTEHRAAGGLGREISMQRVAGEEQLTRTAVHLLLDEAAQWHDGEPGEIEQLRRPGGGDRAVPTRAAAGTVSGAHRRMVPTPATSPR